MLVRIKGIEYLRALLILYKCETELVWEMCLDWKDGNENRESLGGGEESSNSQLCRTVVKFSPLNPKSIMDI